MVGVLVDTAFLITLADETKTRVNHETALAYWKYFRENRVPIYLSAIVVSEYEVEHPINEKVRSACVPLVFDLEAGALAAHFDKQREREPGVARQAVKDDLKIIAQAVSRDVAYVITDDHDTFAKYAERLREAGQVRFAMVLLRDGFDVGYFRIGGQDLLTNQGI